MEADLVFGDNLADLYLDLHAATSIAGVAKVADRVADSVGFTGYMFVHIDPGVGITTIDRRPQEWQKRFYKKGYAERDPLIIESLHQSKPFIWSKKLRPSSLEHRRILAEASEFGLRDGYMIPIKSTTGEKAYLTFFSDRPKDVADAVYRYKTELNIFGLMMYSAYLRARGKPKTIVELTVRERECLLWASRGKTVEDTATIMEISSNTVKAHIKHGVEKLGATNKTHAVVRALLLQLIAT